MKRMASTTIAVLIVLGALLPRPLAAQDYPKRGVTRADFETRYGVSVHAGWTPLSAASLPSDSFEVRVWTVGAMARRDASGVLSHPFKGFSIRRDASVWTGRYVENGRGLVRSVEPRSQWHVLWANLVALGLLTLPDSSELPDPARVADGVEYVVEINAQGRYRTYSYPNPEEQKWPEAKQIIQIVKKLEHELLPKPWDLRWWWWPS